MKLYFTASLTGKKRYQSNYEHIVAGLQKLGHEVIYKHFFGVSAEMVREQTIDRRLAYIKYLDKWLSRCDGFVAETSFPSTSVGFEISRAVQRKVPALVLYANEAGYPPVVAGLEGEYVLIESYDLETLSKVLQQATARLKEILPHRFTMLMPKALLKSMDSVMQVGDSRSEYIRRLIQEDLKRKNK